ncbi:MAG: DUF5837 family protein [Nodosilinea sp. LVE1205-7]|jgi:bacteriocin leader peptide (microcyclamide/patellamide family)
MNHKSITPNPQQPVDRVPTGQLPSALAELSEAELGDGGITTAGSSGKKWGRGEVVCSYDGDDE